MGQGGCREQPEDGSVPRGKTRWDEKSSRPGGFSPEEDRPGDKELSQEPGGGGQAASHPQGGPGASERGEGAGSPWPGKEAREARPARAGPEKTLGARRP